MARGRRRTAPKPNQHQELERRRRGLEQQTVAAQVRKVTAEAAERTRFVTEVQRNSQYLAERINEAAAMQKRLDTRLSELTSVLAVALAEPLVFGVDDLKEHWVAPPFEPGRLAERPPPPDLARYQPPQPGALAGFLPWVRARHENELRTAQVWYEADRVQYQTTESERMADLDSARREHESEIERERRRIAKQHLSVDKFAAAITERKPAAVERLYREALIRSSWPQGFSVDVALDYHKARRRLEVEYRVPSMAIVPVARSYTYVSELDEVVQTEEVPDRRQHIYRQLLAQTALRVLQEIMDVDCGQSSDGGEIVAAVVVNCVVDAPDPGTGQRSRRCVLSVHTDRASFGELKLSQVDPEVCLDRMGARVAERPWELAGVAPFGSDDQPSIPDLVGDRDLMVVPAPDLHQLMEQALASNGLSLGPMHHRGDDQFSWIATDPRPLLGGKVLVWVDRADIVGVAAARALFEEMLQEEARSAVLVALAGFGAAAHRFASGKPVVLISGSELYRHLVADPPTATSRHDDPS